MSNQDNDSSSFSGYRRGDVICSGMMSSLMTRVGEAVMESTVALERQNVSLRESLEKLEAEFESKLKVEIESKLDQSKNTYEVKEMELDLREKKLSEWEKALTEKQRKIEEQKIGSISTANINVLALQQKNTDLHKHCEVLSEEILALYKQLNIQEPLVEVGAGVRLMYLELAKERVPGLEKLVVDKKAWELGQKAPPLPNFSADSALFILDIIPRASRTYNNIFHAVYRGDPEEDKWPWLVEGYHNCEATLKMLNYPAEGNKPTGYHEGMTSLIREFRKERARYIVLRGDLRYTSKIVNGRNHNTEIEGKVAEEARLVLGRMEKIVQEIVAWTKKSRA